MRTKIRQFGAGLMALALAFAGTYAANAATVAKIGDAEYETLADAFTKAKDGDTVNLLASSYTENDLNEIEKLNDKNVVVVGLGMDKTELKVVYGQGPSDVNGLHFQDLALTINHSGYGMPYTQTLCGTYERVKINGLIVVDHGTSSFTDCVFTGMTTGDEYILWQYAGVMLVEHCTFKASASKGVVKLYCESSYEARNLVKDCVFESVTGSKGCAIYASNSNNLEKPIYEMNIVGNTIPAGVAEYKASGNGLTVVNPVKDANGKITSGTFITANANAAQVKEIIGGVVAEGVEVPELVNGQVVIEGSAETAAVAEVFASDGTSVKKCETLAEAFAAAAEQSGTAEKPVVIRLMEGVVQTGDLVLTSINLSHVKVLAAEKGSVLKNCDISFDGSCSHWNDVTFEGIDWDNSSFICALSVFEGDGLAFKHNKFHDLARDDEGRKNCGAIHVNGKCQNFVCESNVFDNLASEIDGGKVAGINSTGCGLTGNITVRNNWFMNSKGYRGMQFIFNSSDGIDDNVLVEGNFFYQNMSCEYFLPDGNPTDKISFTFRNNIIDDITNTAVAFDNIDTESMDVAFDRNCFKFTPDAKPDAFYFNGEDDVTSARLVELGFYPYYASYDKDALLAGEKSVVDALQDLVEPPVKDVAQIGETKFTSINAAFDAVNSQDGDDVTIKILCDFTEELTKDYEWTKDVLITTDKPDGVTVDLGFRYQRDLWCLLGDAHQMMIDDGVTILGLGQLCAGWGDAESVVDVNGDVTAQQLWAFCGTANIGQTSTLKLGYGDGMMKICDSGIVNVTGNLADGEAATLDYFTATPQVDVGYVQSYHYYWASYNRLNLTDTYMRGTSIVSPLGDSFIANLDNSVLYLNEMNPPMIGWTTEANSKLDLVNGSRVICEDAMTFDGEMSIEIGSQIKAKGFVNKGSIDIYAEGLVEPVKVVDYDGTGTMTLEDYGEVAVWDGKSWNGAEAYVEDNDLWVKPLAAPEVEVKDEVEEPVITDPAGQPIPEEKKEAAEQNAADVKTEVTQTLTEPEVAKFEGTGVAESATETKKAGDEHQIIEVKPEVVAKLQEEAEKKEETKDAKDQITKDSKVESRVEIVFNALEVKVDTAAEVVKTTETSVQYDVKPKVKTTVVTTVGEEVKEEVVETVIPNSVIAGNPIKFRLAVDSTFGGFARVLHTGTNEGGSDFIEEYLAEVFTANDANGKKFVELSSDHFSTFKLTSTTETPVCRVGDKNYTSLAEAIGKGGATAEIVLLANIELTADVTLGYNQTIDPGKFAITENPGKVKADTGYEVRNVNGKSVVYAAPTEVTVTGDQKIPVCIEPPVLEQLGGAAALANAEANGFQVWQNYVMGVDGTAQGNKLVPICKPNAENPGAATVTVTTPIAFGAAPAKTGITVSYQLLKSATPQGGFSSVGEAQSAPVFTVDTSAEGNATYWKIQAVFTPEAL